MVPGAPPPAGAGAGAFPASNGPPRGAATRDAPRRARLPRRWARRRPRWARRRPRWVRLPCRWARTRTAVDRLAPAFPVRPLSRPTERRWRLRADPTDPRDPPAWASASRRTRPDPRDTPRPVRPVLSPVRRVLRPVRPRLGTRRRTGTGIVPAVSRRRRLPAPRRLASTPRRSLALRTIRTRRRRDTRRVRRRVTPRTLLPRIVRSWRKIWARVILGSCARR